MFYPTNELLQDLSEKTKLIAQKCSHQIRTTSSTTSSSSSLPTTPTISTTTSTPTSTSNYINFPSQTYYNNPSPPLSPQSNNHHHQYHNNGQLTQSPRISVATLKENAKSGLRSLCSCTGGITGVKHRTPVHQRKTKWYIKQPTWRHWGEERDEDAIFTVYLKKVRYHRPTPSVSSSQDSDDEISHLEWETIRVRFVKAATLSRLVDSLTADDGELESTFVNVFLATYRTFARPDEVLELLISRYEALHEESHSDQVADQHKKTLVSALHVWLDGYPEDWNGKNLHKLLSFTSKHLADSELHLKALRLNDRLAFSRSVPLPWTQDVNELSEQFGGFCLTPAFRGPPMHVLQTYRFPHINVQLFAEQLTRMDTELFKRVIPHQCLGATWARRDKREADTVLATVAQFNAVSRRVASSILIEKGLKPTDRALYISVWIDIAQELRVLKNFSSLKSIVSGLQSNPIYRLTKIWAALPREKLELFNELARIVSEDNNAIAQREILMREGTAKFANIVGENDRHLQKVFQRQNHYISHGTIPYLGTFLTDLTMIHTANPDFLNNGLINFDKRRKEFEILAQIKLLQGAANSYSFPEDPLFDRWFASFLVLDDNELHDLSCILEAPVEPKSRNHYGHKKNDSITSNSSSGAGSQLYPIDHYNSSISSRNNSLDRDISPPNASIMSRASSVSSLSMDSSSSGQKSTNLSHKTNKSSTTTTSSGPIINGQLVNKNNSNSPPDFYIIRVTFESDNVELDGIVLYKSIMLGNNERTPQVILNAMMKLGLEGNPNNFTLSQMLPDRDLVMPSNANVYYAVSTQYNLNFILRPKKDDSLIGSR